jgi:hypothetical protein
MRSHLALLSAVLILPLAGLPASAQTAGVTAAVNPSADRTPPGQTMRAITLGDNIVQNERIDTGSDGLVQVLLADGTTFTVGPNSSISIDRFVYDPDAGTAEVAATMTRGVFRFIGGRTSKTPGGVRLDTPVGTVGIRGGMVDINLTPSQAGLLAHFDLLFGNEVTLDGPDGGRRVYSAGYSLWVDALGRSQTGKTPPEWRSQVLQSLTGNTGMAGGSPNRPTDQTVASSNVPGSNSGLPQTMQTGPTPRPHVTQDPYAQSTDRSADRYSGEYRGFAAGVADVRTRVVGFPVNYRSAARNSRPGDVTTRFDGEDGPFEGEIGVRAGIRSGQVSVGGASGPSAFVDNDRYGGLGLTEGQTSYMISGRSGSSDIPALQGFDLCESCDFIQWGWWGTQIGSGQQQITVTDGTWVTGDITSRPELAGLAADAIADTTYAGATYTGRAVGSMATSDGISAATGDMSMSWNFGTGRGDLAISDFGGRDFSYDVRRDRGAETFSGIGFGQWSAGTANGAFVNDGDDLAAGVIGSFDQTGIGWMATGVFGGTRD